MEGKGESSHASFTSAMNLTKSGAPNVPSRTFFLHQLGGKPWNPSSCDERCSRSHMGFFDLPLEGKMLLMSDNVHAPIMDQNKNWVSVPLTEGALLVQLGDQIEVMSNGQYKSVVHRATVSPGKKRFSIASLHSLALNKKMGPALELVDEQHPASYKEFSFRDFLDYISNNAILGFFLLYQYITG
ncbi:hypothetical protein GH714_039322 [Hevea brasiliensis]|uniref:Isopenicillin N synthase-like Fe(2+) 2OG dioxygenase domain-containing protein n=1 Tax=Hevea brasiliensis TaxID=3981 RepID=A0A6A6MSD5_HEVBR|nr:hypothetical protein GH714_039322 [Hevea brasiliensis]